MEPEVEDYEPNNVTKALATCQQIHTLVVEPRPEAHGEGNVSKILLLQW